MIIGWKGLDPHDLVGVGLDLLDREVHAFLCRFLCQDFLEVPLKLYRLNAELPEAPAVVLFVSPAHVDGVVNDHIRMAFLDRRIHNVHIAGLHICCQAYDGTGIAFLVLTQGRVI